MATHDIIDNHKQKLVDRIKCITDYSEAALLYSFKTSIKRNLHSRFIQPVKLIQRFGRIDRIGSKAFV